MYLPQKARKVPRIHPLHYIDPYYYVPLRKPEPNCCDRLLSYLLRSFLSLLVVLGIAALLLWLFFRPGPMRVAVEAATLARFQLMPTNPPFLSYNITTAIGIANPNSFVGVHYDWLEADMYYRGARFGWVGMTPFYQADKSNATVQAALAGGSYFWLNSAGVEEFGRENVTGVFGVDVWMYAHVRYRFRWVATRRQPVHIKCPLRLQLAPAGGRGTGFNRTRCDVVKYWVI